MNIVSQLCVLAAAVLHVFIFCMEGLWFMRPTIHTRFGAATTTDAEARRLLAFNQGFYNLSLALGALIGLALVNFGGNTVVGRTLVLFCCACMLGAGIVLFFSAGRRTMRAAVIQGIFPLLAWAFWLWL